QLQVEAFLADAQVEVEKRQADGEIGLDRDEDRVRDDQLDHQVGIAQEPDRHGNEVQEIHPLVRRQNELQGARQKIEDEEDEQEAAEAAHGEGEGPADADPAVDELLLDHVEDGAGAEGGLYEGGGDQGQEAGQQPQRLQRVRVALDVVLQVGEDELKQHGRGK